MEEQQNDLFEEDIRDVLKGIVKQINYVIDLSESDIFNSESDLTNILSSNVLVGDKLALINDTVDGMAQKELEVTKVQILEIYLNFQLLMNFISIFPGFRKAFIQSNKNRRLMLGKEAFFIHTKDNLPLLEYKSSKQKELEKKGYLKWEGVGMTIPESAYVSLSRGATWISMYMRKKGLDSENDVEISIFEKPMHIEILSNDRKKFKLLQGDGDGTEIKSKQDDSIAFSRSEEFSKVRVDVLEKLKEFQVVLEVPFFTPSDDMLTEVQFKNSEDIDVILSTGC